MKASTPVTMQRRVPSAFPRRSALPAIASALIVLFAGCESGGAGTGTPAVSSDGGASGAGHMSGIALDSAAVEGWASQVTAYRPGREVTGFGDVEAAIGPASGIATEVLVLGRGGSVTVRFSESVANRDGAEFAVFENGLGTVESLFAELAYVEVSSNGTDFARFPVSSGRDETVGAYERVDTADYSGFAGLHPRGTGTAFDLAELSGEPEVAAGRVDLRSISYIRLVDVIGDGSETDGAGSPIYDPYPTSGTAGFDLDGVAYLGGGP